VALELEFEAERFALAAAKVMLSGHQAIFAGSQATALTKLVFFFEAEVEAAQSP